MTLPAALGRHSDASIADRVLGIVQARPSLAWLALAGSSAAALGVFVVSAWVLVDRGPGVWGVNIPAAWGFAITNFVFFVGVGHAGTLISVVLLLTRQPARTSINRIAETMTVYAVATAGLFPILHLGRLSRFYWLLPYPNTMEVWPQWRSALVWDAFAVMTYAVVSSLFWYVGLIPDLATLRDSARRGWVRRIAGVFALGWRGEARHWQRYKMLYLLLAGLTTPLVVSVHSVVSLDFAIGIVPGWHSTIFPPYFVASAVYSGFATVLLILIPLRAKAGLRDLITMRHLDVLGKLMLACGLFVTYSYTQDYFLGWYSGDEFELSTIEHRLRGPVADLWWTAFTINSLLSQALWVPAVRRSPLALWLIALCIDVGVWLDHFVDIVTSLEQGFMPSAWGFFYPTRWDWLTLLGALGFFWFLLSVTLRFVPMLPLHELRELLRARGRLVPSPADVPRPPPTLAVALDEPPLLDEELFGVVAEFDDHERLLAAARAAREAGWEHLQTYTPYPIDGLVEALGLRRTLMPALVFFGAVSGAGAVYFMQWYASAVSYPWVIAGRPFNSWPSYAIPTFESLVLGGTLTGVLALLALNRLPRLYHPFFNMPGSWRVSRDRFFVALERKDEGFDRERARRFLESLRPIRVCEVPL